MEKIIFTIIILFVSYTQSECQNNKSTVPKKFVIVFKDWALDLNLQKFIGKADYTKNDIIWDVNNLPSYWGRNGQQRLELKDLIPVTNQTEIVGYLKVYQYVIRNTQQGTIIEFWDKSKKNKIWAFTNKMSISANCANVVSDKNLLYIVTFNLISTGSDLVCLDKLTGKLIWKADVKQLLVGHSKYSNEVFITKYENSIIIAGDEAGGSYLQFFNARTGENVFTKMKNDW